MLTFGLDFDDTFTACPELWAMFVVAAEAADHRVFIVTARRDTEENGIVVRHALKSHGLVLPIVFTSLASKLRAVEERGIKVDIWLDDNPHALVHGH